MSEINQSKVIVVFGQRGSGKSTLTKELLQTSSRLIVFDPMGEYSNGVVFTDMQQMYNFLIKHGDKKFKVVYYPLDDKNDMEVICEYAKSLENLTLCVEEIDLFCTPNTIMDGFNYVIRRGRHHNIEVVCVSQRPYGINRIITSQAHEVYSFVMREPRDVQYLVSFFGQEAEQVQNLQPFEYLKFCNGGVEKLGGYNKKLAHKLPTMYNTPNETPNL